MELGVLFKLFYEFFIIGIFAIGGGMSALPLIEHVVVNNGWLNVEQFYHMVAIAESTPGPIGINVATYVGFNEAGIIGAVIASLATVIFPFFFLMIIIKIIDRYYKTKAVQSIFIGLRAVILGLILTAAYNISKIAFFEASHVNTFGIVPASVLIFSVIMVLFIKYKKHPLLYIALGAILGLIFL